MEAKSNGGVRIGVYVCHCGSNIAAQVDVKAVAEYAAAMPGVVLSKDYKYMCSDPGQEMIKQDIKDHQLTRIVVASCSPLLHEHTFRGATADGGLNPYYFHMVNIREHDSWVHEDRTAATEKAKDLVRAAVRRVTLHTALETRQVPIHPDVMIVGGGIAGIHAALTIAKAGKKVYLVEKEPTIGGHMAQFDKTFPTLDCAACILTPKMSEVRANPNIELWTLSEVAKVDGSVGNFQVTVRRKPKYVIEDLCVGCLECVKQCVFKEAKFPDAFNVGLGKRKPIYMPFPQAVPQVVLIDPDTCIEFKTGKCKKTCALACDRQAIDFKQPERIETVTVGTIVLATGFKVFDAKRVPEYRYGKMPDVYTSLEVERMVTASGPSAGEIVLRNGKHPKTVGIIHCVGSRDVRTNRYCSRVCCMYSLKLAHLIKEHTGAEVYNFYIDMRTPGKGYEEFYDRLLEEGVHFVRGRVAEVTDVPETKEEKGRMVLRVEDTLAGAVRRIPVDMVVLSVGLEPRADSADVRRLFNISCASGGFFLERHPKLAPVNTATDGIFIAGACQGPKDIPDTVAQAAAAAAGALSLSVRGKVKIEPITCQIVEDRCSGCRLCNTMCPFSAITFDAAQKVSSINDAVCKGCGTCAATCPSGAILARHFTDQQLMGEIAGVMA
jgi:heterodisulfide reductase subunit A2